MLALVLWMGLCRLKPVVFGGTTGLHGLTSITHP